MSIQLNKNSLWVFGAALMSATVSTVAFANPEAHAVVLNAYGMPAPLLLSWSVIWMFAIAGGIGSLFFKVPAIDQHFRYLLVAKPFLGVFGAMSLCLVLTAGREPPEGILSAYAFISALLSAPILQGLLAVVSIPKNQAEVLNAINPFKFRIVPASLDANNKENNQ